MLNLTPIFDDAIEAVRDHSSFLSVAPLPATVFLLQRDVINHYRYALTHYFDLTLNEPFLQNSTIGTPYAKWAKFTNEDFELLAFTTHNLIRYTSRLLHETHCKALENAERFSEMKSLSNSYTNPICDLNYKSKTIGIRVNDDRTLCVTPFANGPSIDGDVRLTSTAGGPTHRYHTTVDADGRESTTEITQEEYEELTQTLREACHDITDRSTLRRLKDRGLSELDDLIERNMLFGKVCAEYHSGVTTFSPFEELHQSWCV